MRFRGAMTGLSVFLVLSTAASWLVYATLRRDVAGPTTPYAAVFTDVFGLRDGDDVRIAGVRVGRVEKIDLDGDFAKVSFVVQRDQQIFGNTLASVTYQSIVGQRYLGLTVGASGSPEPLPAKSVIPPERTEPSFDVGKLLNGYEPLFSFLDPTQTDNLANGIIQSLQGDDASITLLVDQSASLAETFGGQDQVLDDVIINMTALAGDLAEQSGNLDATITQTTRTVADLNSRRPDLVSSVGSIGRVLHRLSVIADDVFPSVQELLTRQPGFAKHMLEIEPSLAFLGANLPLALKGLARTTGEGAYGNAYLCDVNITGFFPGLNDVIPIIVNAATPGGTAWHTPRCRNMSDG